jgi:hypothetical protein
MKKVIKRSKKKGDENKSNIDTILNELESEDKENIVFEKKEDSDEEDRFYLDSKKTDSNFILEGLVEEENSDEDKVNHRFDALDDIDNEEKSTEAEENSTKKKKKVKKPSKSEEDDTNIRFAKLRRERRVELPKAKPKKFELPQLINKISNRSKSIELAK